MLAQTKILSHTSFSQGLSFLPGQGMRFATSSFQKLGSIAETSQPIQSKYQQSFEQNIEQNTKTLSKESSFRKQMEKLIPSLTSTDDINDLQKRAAAANCKLKNECIDLLHQFKNEFLVSLTDSGNFTADNPLDKDVIEDFNARISYRISQLADVQYEVKYNLKGNIAGVGKFEEKHIIEHYFQRNSKSKFFRIKTNDFFQEINKIFSDEKNYLQPQIKSSIRELIESNNEYNFSKFNGMPGLHAEIQALNSLLKKFNDFKESFNEKITLSNMNKNKQKEYVSKLADISDHIGFSGIRLITVQTRANAPGSHFKACKNCTGILETLQEVYGITPEVPSGFVEPSMRFKIKVMNDF
ncbi:MAG: YwqJ-related putative deaminase [Pseudomonadota bacterium]